MNLSRQQRKELQEALINAFPNTASLEQMLSFELDKNLKQIAGEGNLQVIVFKLIQTANSQGWIEDLVRAACESNPGNKQLQAVADEMLKQILDVPTNPVYGNQQPTISRGSVVARGVGVCCLVLGLSFWFYVELQENRKEELREEEKRLVRCGDNKNRWGPMKIMDTYRARFGYECVIDGEKKRVVCSEGGWYKEDNRCLRSKWEWVRKEDWWED